MNTVVERYRDDSTTVYSDGTDLVYERIFDAPRDVVWQAFMDPDRIPRWWGPHGTTTTVVEMDVRVSGTWRYISRAPDRDDVVFHGEYLEIVPPEQFSWTFLFEVPGVGDVGGPETFVFEDLGGRTKLISTSHFPSTDDIEGALEGGMINGAVESWDRFAAMLAGG
jgi:uncharacterized protein YndB with AHSA1/START domain